MNFRLLPALSLSLHLTANGGQTTLARVVDWPAAWMDHEPHPRSILWRRPTVDRLLHEGNRQWCRDAVSQIVRFDSSFSDSLEANLLSGEDVDIFEKIILEMEILFASIEETESDLDSPAVLVQEMLDTEDENQVSYIEIRFWYTVQDPAFFVEQMSQNLSMWEDTLIASGIRVSGLDPPIHHPALTSPSDGCVGDEFSEGGNDKSSANAVALDGISVKPLPSAAEEEDNQPTTMQDWPTSTKVLITLVAILVVIGITIIGLILMIRQERLRGDYDGRRSGNSSHAPISMKKTYPNADTGIPIEQETRA